MLPPTAGRFARLASAVSAVSAIILRRPLYLVWIVGPAVAFYLMWERYRIELSQLVQSSTSNGESLGVIVLTLVLLAALLSFAIAHLAHTMDNSRFWVEKSVGVGATLGRLSAETTAVQTDLVNANERLRLLDTLKSKFVAEVGHELRAPLAAIVSAANIILRHHTTKPEAVDRFGLTIVTEAKRLARLVNDLLDLTKIEANAIEWDDSDTDVSELVRQVVLSVEPVAIDEQVVLETEIQDGPPDLYVDRDRILQVLTNLLNNALKFTPEGGTVTLRASYNENEVVFAVEDTGVGIAEEDHQYIFDRFVQARSRSSDYDPSSSSVTSTGLGLCISKEIVEHYDGKIWVQSKVGNGSTFCFSIPVAPAVAHRSDVAATVHAEARPLCVLALLDSEQLTDRIRSIDASTTVKCRPCKNMSELTAGLTSYLPDAVLISASLIPELHSDLFEAMRGHGMTEFLVHAKDGRIQAHAVRDSSVIAVRKLRYYASRGARILLVDDDRNFLEIVEWELRHAGYVVRTATDGYEALEILKSEKIDAALLDVILPHVDGLSVLESLGKFAKKIPVIMLTAMSDEDVISTAKALGAVDVIRKDGIEPTANIHILARIQRVLGPLLTNDDQAKTQTEPVDAVVPAPPS